MVFGVSLVIAPGEVVALLGRNGMGKSTTIKVICGLLPATSGTVTFDGRNLAGVASYKVARAGVGLVPEGRRTFAPLSVEENLIAAARPGKWTLETVAALFPRLGERMGQKAASLSGGEQQMLAIGRALMTNPRLLILDEATEGLAPVVRQEIWSVLRRLKGETDLSLLVVDKSLRELGTVADHAVVVESGKTRWNGPFADLSTEITEQYLGV